MMMIPWYYVTLVLTLAEAGWLGCLVLAFFGGQYEYDIGRIGIWDGGKVG